MKNTLSIVTLVALLSGCSSLLPQNWFHEEGFVWCNARYLDLTSPEYQNKNTVNPQKDKRFRLAQEGYIYALLGAYELQKKGKSEDVHFRLPSYIEPINSADSGGFQATSFKVYDSPEKIVLKEVVVSYRGTDSFGDWFRHNLHPSPDQYKPAQDFLLETVNKFPDAKVVVTGFSLGGGLAMNVLRAELTSSYVDEAWAFNTSPRTGVETELDSRLYLLSVQGEILGATRWIKEGPATLGAPDKNFSNGYNLIDASSSYLHSRWVLTRQILIFADMAYYEEADRTENYVSPPLEILKLAAEPEGCYGETRKFLEDRGRL